MERTVDYCEAKPMEKPDWFYRLIEERDALSIRLEKLEDFCDSPAFGDLDGLNRRMLCDQRAYMLAYLNVLNQRISINQNNW